MPRVSAALDRLYSEVSEETNQMMFKCMSKAMRLAKREVIARSPVNQGNYKRGWTVRTKRLKYGFEGIIYNKTRPSLTHLLNNGHVKANQYGSFGRKAGDRHISIAQEIAEEYLVQLLMEETL